MAYLTHLRRRGVMFVSAALIFACALCGCGKIEHPTTEDGYATDYAMSATEYTLFLQKQILVLNNVLFTRSLMADDVAEGKYDAKKELESAEKSIEQVETLKDEITAAMPASGYETDRQDAIDIAEDARIVLDDYIENLKNGNSSGIMQNAEQMRECAVAVSGNANQYYE